MQALFAMAFAVVSVAPLASRSAELTDSKSIQAFMADPQSHLYNIRDPKGWKSYRKLIQVGTKQPDGSCRYPLAVTTSGTYVSFATEIGVNKARCQSLILEGNPGGGPTRAAQNGPGKHALLTSNVQARKAVPNQRP